jgi:hypothetical protein
MCPSSEIHNINAEIIKEAINKSHEKINNFIIDLDGVGQHKDKILNLLKETNQKYMFIHELL